ncbi:hypothetical protein KW790_00180 [Candidatus Parcubacteria bacterium]|nr:hypothetical protein [Candidatus Parcubacteria bacterium]
MLPLLWWIPIWVITFYLLMSLKVFAPDEIAAVYRLNKRVEVVGPGGINFYPWLLYSVKRFKTQTVRVIIPGKKEQIVRNDDTPLQPGEVRPIRVLQTSLAAALFYKPKVLGDPSKGYEDKLVTFQEFVRGNPELERAMREDSLHSSLTTELISYVDWDLKTHFQGDPKKHPLFDFVENVGSIESANVRIDSTVRGALQDLFAPLTAGHAAHVKGYLQELIKKRVEILVGEKNEDSEKSPTIAERPWGINVSAAQIEEINPGKRVNEARADEATAVSIRNKTVKDAEASRDANMKTADGDAYREKTIGEAEAEAFEKKSKILATDGGFRAAQLEAVKSVYKDADTIVTNGDLGNLVGALTAVNKASGSK